MTRDARPSGYCLAVVLSLLLFFSLLAGCGLVPGVEEPAYDVVIYGGTSAGISAAVQIARMGKSVVVVSPDKHLGGLSSGGLGWTDSGDKEVIGGIAREFYQRDARIQAYCFRMCLTKVPDNRVAFAKPEGYDPKQYELLARVLETGWDEVFHKFDPIPNNKTDTNNHGPFSTDNIGMNYDYPEAGYERRREIILEHELYQKGLMYFLANDPRVPERIRSEMSQCGLAKDEFTDNANWPHQIYVREGRRMLGEYVMTEHDCLGTRDTPGSVGMGSYTADSHNVQRYITAEGHVQNEGDVGVRLPGPYRIDFGTIVPKAEECTNLLVPVAVSASHIAFGSVRMEPVFMILGQSAATAAVMSIEAGIPVQALPYERLRERLRADGQILTDDDVQKN